MIKDIEELNFPSYATLESATVTLADMGERTITAQIKIDGDIKPDFSFDWEIVHDRHKYTMPLRKPQGSKDNTTLNSVVDLTFQHWAVYQLKRWPFVTMQPIETGTAVADEEVADVSLNLGDFCDLFNQVLVYYYGDKITLDLNPEWQYKSESEIISISHTKVWNVLIETFYDKFGVRWQIEPNGSLDKYVIKVGYPTTEQSHIFEYGFEGGLLKVERQVQSDEICNMIKGRGGEKNIPYRYFKNVDPQNPSFKADPDWIEELENIYFSNLMPATFRSYVQGWKAAHISKYPDYKVVGESNAYAPWAYRKGFTDTKFHPVEFVADEITTSPESGDKQIEILPGYSPYVKKGSSLDKYGTLQSSLDNNDEIYPTIQGVVVSPYGRIDEVVAVEKILSDDIEQAAENDAIVSNVGGCRGTAIKVKASEYNTFTIQGSTFTVPTGKSADLDVTPRILSVSQYLDNKKVNADVECAEITHATIKVYGSTGLISASGIPSGVYRYEVEVTVHNVTTDKIINVTIGDESPTLIAATPQETWNNVWRIWVKNIWGTEKLNNETATQYAERVWRPILGDREGNEAKVVFASGALSTSEDYEFTIISTPKYERKDCKWQTVENGNIVEHEYISEWCITLGKSDADLESLGVYLPSTMRQAVAGDFFFFIGIDMPFVYTKWGEERVDDWKKGVLPDKKDIKPTWVVQTDRVSLNNEGKKDALIRQLHPGDTLRLADKRFIEGAYETLYLSSLNITYRKPTKDDTALNPDVEIVLSDSYATSANPVATLQGEVSALAKQVGSISNVEQIVRAVGDKLYLRKDGISDRSMSPTRFFSLLASGDFRAGLVGGAGWGFFKDDNGNWVLEADRVNARQDISANTVIINQVAGRGGMEVDTAAFIDSVTKVVETDSGYVCYFDQKDGSVANLFHIDDVAYCNRWTPENTELKFYKRRVVEVGVDYITLTKGYTPVILADGSIDTGVNGTGIPAEKDNIIHFGNYTDGSRQYVKVRDVVGGGYERYIEGLNSVDAEGVEYYFIGKQNGISRWFVGNKDLVPYSGLGDGSYIEYINRRFNLNNVTLSIGSKIGDTTLGDILDTFDDSKYLREAFGQSTDIHNGLVLTSAILLGRTNDLDERETWAGHNGLYQTPKTIASFWGGSMVDRFFNEDGTSRDGLLTSGFAASLVRMDGSAYFAKGNIGFNADGSGWLGNYDNGIRFGSDGSMTFGNGIKIALNGTDSGLQSTLESLLNYFTGLSSCIIPVDIDGNTVSWGDFDAIHALKSVKSLYSEGGLSALGMGGDAPQEVPGSTGGLDEAALAEWLPDNGYKKWTEIQAQFAAAGYLTQSVADTLYQPRGSYLTEHQSLANYVDLTSAQTIQGKKIFAVGQWQLQSTENSEISDISYGNSTIVQGQPDTTSGAALGAIRRGLAFRWYSDYWVIGNIRSGSVASDGFGIGLHRASDSKLDLGLRVTKSKVYAAAYGTFAGDTLWHSGNDGAGSGLDADMLDGLHANGFFRQSIAGIDAATFPASLPAGVSGSYAVNSAGWWGSVVAFHCYGSNSGLAFYRRGGSNSIPEILTAIDSTSNWVNKGEILTTSATQTITGEKTFEYAIIHDRATGAFIGSARNGMGEGFAGGLFYAYGQNPLWLCTNDGHRTLKVEKNGSIFQSKLECSNLKVNNGSIDGVTSLSGSGSVSPYIKGTANGLDIAFPTNAGNLGTGVGIGWEGRYGTYFWSDRSGKGYIQQGRQDGINTAYELILQPYGGTVRVVGGLYSDSYVSALGTDTSSDLRLKDVVSEVRLSLEQIAAIPAKRFTWKKRPELGLQVGTIAQAIQTILPEVVHTTQDDTLSVAYGQLACAALPTLADETLRLKREIRILRQRIARLEMNQLN